MKVRISSKDFSLPRDARMHANSHRSLVKISSSINGLPDGTVYCVGRNYAEHIKELPGLLDIPDSLPSSPMIFLKSPATIRHNESDLILPSWSNDVHHEVCWGLCETVMTHARCMTCVPISRMCSDKARKFIHSNLMATTHDHTMLLFRVRATGRAGCSAGRAHAARHGGSIDRLDGTGCAGELYAIRLYGWRTWNNQIRAFKGRFSSSKIRIAFQPYRPASSAKGTLGLWARALSGPVLSAPCSPWQESTWETWIWSLKWTG